MAPALDRARIGSAPDSWGVRFPDEPLQPWESFLDEVAEAGCSSIAPDPYGYLPTDPARLTDEAGRRNLEVPAGTVLTGPHRGPAVWEETRAHGSRVAALADVVEDGVPFGPAVRRGVMCESLTRVPDLEPVPVAARGLGVELSAIAEQDMYSCEPDRPLPVAVRPRDFLRSCGA
ncbi:hypothetical protein [Streptomyces sp. NPDC006527]|uniref:hypothetical protein n=1 Tax=Streptomyces sp. NPDC006527 TaxID=3364749 RepID=UPI003692DAA0